MSRIDLIEAGGFLSVTAMVAGLAVAFLVPGMEPACFVGTLPGLAYLVGCHFINWEREI